MKKKLLSFICAFALLMPCLLLFTGCSKKEQENTIQFSGVYQSAEGHLYATVDNLPDFEDVGIEYSIDGGQNWYYCSHSNRQFFQTDKSMYVAALAVYGELVPNSQLSVGLRLTETDKFKASAPTLFKAYTVKPICEIDEIFQQDVSTSKESYTQAQGYGKTTFRLFKNDTDDYVIEKYNYAISGENEYEFTFEENNWDKTNLNFEYLFVPINQAYYGTAGSMYKTGLEEYYNLVQTNEWLDYNNFRGISKEVYESHIENSDMGCIGCYNRVFTILIRIKGTETNLPSVCSTIHVDIENIIGELPQE